MIIENRKDVRELWWVYRAASFDEERPRHLWRIHAGEGFVEAADNRRIHRVNRQLLPPGLWWPDSLVTRDFHEDTEAGAYPRTIGIIEAVIEDATETITVAEARAQMGSTPGGSYETWLRAGDLTVMLNRALLADALHNTPSGTVYVASPQRAVVIVGGDRIAAIMPMVMG